MRQENEDARSRKSHLFSKTASQIAKSGAGQSLAGSAALLRERLQKDFGGAGRDEYLLG